VIFYGFETTRTICILRFVYQGTRYLRDDRLSVILGGMQFKAKVQLQDYLFAINFFLIQIFQNFL
jgi:hypothetical protein